MQIYMCKFIYLSVGKLENFRILKNIFPIGIKIVGFFAQRKGGEILFWLLAS